MQQVQQVALSKLAESPTNPRQLFGDLSGLVESIREHGVLQPLVARHVGEQLELVFGHRRFRAAKEAGLKTVPVIVRELGDVEVLEQQLIENLQREDVHPLEVASAYSRLHSRGLKAEQIAARVGVSRSEVFSSMKLLDLTEAPRKAFLAGRLEAASALQLARVQGERLQTAALAEIERLNEKHGGRAPVRLVQRLVQERYMGERSRSVRARAAKKAAAGDAAHVERTAELLVARVAELLTRKPHLDDADLRVLLLALAESSDAATDVLQRRGVRTDRLAGLRSSRLHALLAEVALLPWLRAAPEAARGLARAYRVDLAELDRTAKSLLDAEGVFS